MYWGTRGTGVPEVLEILEVLADARSQHALLFLSSMERHDLDQG
jgi:hypothetical protein